MNKTIILALKSILILFSSQHFISCQGKIKQVEKKIDKQYLLTNEIKFKERNLVLGASAYLVKGSKGNIYMCTARHLMGPDMGLDPAINTSDFKDSLEFWYIYPRKEKYTNETLEVTDLLNFKNEEHDISIFKLKSPPKKIGVLEPRYTQLEKGEKVRILGCEYSDEPCFQKIWYGTINDYTIADQIEVFMDKNDIEVPGFSGAPVIDASNHVIGHLIAGAVFSDTLKVYIQPINVVKKYLN